MRIATSRNSLSRNGARAPRHPMPRATCWRAGSRRVQLTDLAHGFLVEGTGVGRLVEIEVAAENLVGTLAREHHLDAHRLDDARQQVHRRRGAYGRHVVGLDIIDHVAHGIQPLLYGVVDFVVYGADMVGDLACRRQVGRPFQPDGERVELRPPGPSRSFDSTRRSAYFLATAEMIDESRPPDSSTP